MFAERTFEIATTRPQSDKLLFEELNEIRITFEQWVTKKKKANDSNMIYYSFDGRRNPMADTEN